MSFEKVIELLLAVLTLCEAVNDRLGFVDAKLDELFEEPDEGSGPDEELCFVDGEQKESDE